ncbi:MAG: phage tail protein, partial [Pseudomonadaceae bacterium]|nr:phage tail protein [Pseudomonadaceae bacterium]
MSRPGLSYEPLLSSWNVGSVIADICARAGVPVGSIYIDELEGAVEGFSVTNANAVSSAIEALSAIYLFDPSNFDGRLHFVPRGGAVVAAITSDDLVEGSETESSSRRDSLTVPRTLHLQYLDTLGGLTTDKQTSDRSLDNRSNSETKLETTVIMRADDAARAAVISHKVAIEEQRGEVEFSLPDSWCWLTVADIITLDGVRLRITEIQTDEGQQAYKCQHDRASA